MKKPDNLTVIVVWESITAFGAFIGICAIAFIAFPDAVNDMLGSAMPGAVFGLSISVLVLICYIGVAIAGGVGLLKGKEWGRVLSIAHAALSLISFPIGTVIGIIIIMYLTKSEVKDYFQAGSSGQQ